MATHFDISMPKGARNMPEIPIIMQTASFLDTSISMSIFSTFLLPSSFSMEPTDKNSKDFETAWKITSNIAAQIDSRVPTLAHITISPRFAIVE